MDIVSANTQLKVYITPLVFDEEFQTYTLGFPNEEVRYGFLNFVLPFYTPIDSENGNDAKERNLGEFLFVRL